MWNRPARRRARTIVALAIAALVPATTALGAGDDQKVALTKSGQAAARAAVLTRADLGISAAWTRVPNKPSGGSGSARACRDFHMKESDLVLNGRAEAGFKASGIQFGSQSAVYQTTRMGQLYWQRFVQSPRLLECMSASVLLGAVNQAKVEKMARPRLASARRIAFPAVGAHTRALRMLVDVPTASGDVRVLADLVFIWRGRTQLLLMTTAPYAIAAVITPAEGRLARVLVSRMRA